MNIHADSVAYSEAVIQGHPALFTLEEVAPATVPADLYAAPVATGGMVLTTAPLSRLDRPVEPDRIALGVGDCHTIAAFMEKYGVRLG